MALEEIIGPHRLILGDCAQVMQTLQPVDACVMDPPYGIGEANGKNLSRGKPIGGHSRSQELVHATDYGRQSWDDTTADDAVLMAIGKARHSVVFGGNYYSLPPTSCWLVWDKLNGASDFADCELAWTNLPKAVRRIRFLWNGCMRMERDVPREHPTQKPIEVMRWCIEHLPPTARTILDPFMGSGTTGVAAAMLGREFIGIEREEKYFSIACRRIEAAMRQPDLFIEQPKPKAQQLDMLT